MSAFTASDGRLALAIDPGTACGAALWGFDGYVWSKQGAPEEVAHALACHKLLPRVALLAIEDTFVAHDKAKVRGSIASAENAGRIHGTLLLTPLPRIVWLHPWRPTSSHWRAQMGWPRMKTEEAKQRALDYAALVVGEASWFSRASRSHEAEAVCMAEVAYHRMIEGTC